MRQLGLLEEWLNATAVEGSTPAVRFSSCFPMQRGTLFAPPPAGVWPPRAESGLKTRWHGAKFVPVFALNRVLRGEGLRDEDYELDGHSGCLLPSAAHQPTGPFRYVRRTLAPVDRVTGASAAPESTTCLQFAPGSGLWCAAGFANPTAYAVWEPKVKAAFRLLADTGLGGHRSLGFGRSRQPEFQPGQLSELLLGGVAAPATGERRAWWVLSLYSPAELDELVWGAGDYHLQVRGGRVDSPMASGAEKRQLRMLSEGSVVVTAKEPKGRAIDVAPVGHPHPVWRAGYALALPIPYPAGGRSVA
jgi:CRISPR type III-A-associated RAMP protein Csm4